MGKEFTDKNLIRCPKCGSEKVWCEDTSHNNMDEKSIYQDQWWICGDCPCTFRVDWTADVINNKFEIVDIEEEYED